MIQKLYEIIQDRKANPKEDSYTNTLLNAGEDEILKKVGEESVEVILAAKGQGKARLVEEVADLMYHSLVLLVQQDVSLAEVEGELERRHQTGGAS
ncbi:MAG: phosphoribosyl-ATP diphosphatase [Chloroflexi bacterium]|nr:MAG: phosphoribosyl-ATP diphosphatase [Chloroflexota bacterium]MBL1192893.1 phosphoribosyl-ATP diphosphatase [Chloroflexota bacterium]NOH10185.1 phosphoribosyl-ATP diphosphatase [Chloroflexota bacterium]